MTARARPPHDLVVRSRRTLLGGRLQPGWIALDSGWIVASGRGPAPRARTTRDAGSDPIGPSLVDTHVHGFGGFDASDAGVDSLRGMARALRAAGVGAFCPTLYPLSPSRTLERLRAIDAVRRAPEADEALVIGAHLEGPFVNPLRAGALDRKRILAPDASLLRRYLETGAVAIVTLAPELRGADRLVKLCRDYGVLASMGHSAATLEEARRATKSGARSVTHLFNAMSPPHHRHASLANFALLEPGFATELIGDLEHVTAPTVDLLLRARGLDGIRLVSDSLRAAGTRCLRFRAGGAPLTVRNGIALRSDGTIAGSARSLASSVTGLARAGLLSLEESWRLAAVEPARLLGLRAAPGWARLG